MDKFDVIEGWIIEKMRGDMWYEINGNDLPIYKILIDEKYGWPKFQLSLSPDFKQVKKTMI